MRACLEARGQESPESEFFFRPVTQTLKDLWMCRVAIRASSRATLRAGVEFARRLIYL